MPEFMKLRGEEALLAHTGELIKSVRKEFVIVGAGISAWPLSPVCAGLLRVLETNNGHVVRKLLSPVALADAKYREYLHAVAAGGPQVRIAATPLPHNTIVLDRRIAILADRNLSSNREYTVTTAPALVGGIYALFEAAWESATSIATFLRGEQPFLDAESRAILRALGSGITDENAARKLGMSLRTYRRRVAELLQTLGARSRFQAGLRAGALGITD
ncbi:hypothetical protein [Nocardia sp. SC052]|uniref:hypothetical protein n=1 Tax=Nocardia sichangensis TaxID=3385975 RepID=UPI00399F467E